jgi:hypothetical protein
MGPPVKRVSDNLLRSDLPAGRVTENATFQAVYEAVIFRRVRVARCRPQIPRPSSHRARRSVA